MTRLIGLLALLSALCVSASAFAQGGPLIIDRSRPDRAPAAAEAAPRPSVAVGSVKQEAQAFQPFVFQRVAVQGSSLSADALRASVAPFVGKTLNLADLTQLTGALSGVYAKSDVALYSILLPRQTFEGGVVRIRVVEGFVADARVKPQKGRPAPKQTQAYADALKGKAPLSKAALERQLNLMRDIPGATPKIQFLQSSQPGGVVLDVEPSVKRLETGLSVNSRGATMLGKTQVELDVNLNSLLREGDRTSIVAVLPTEVKRFQYISVAERQPIGDQGASITANIGYLRTRPKLAGFDIRGEAKSGGLTVAYPMLRSNTKNLFLTGGVDALNSDNALFGRQISQEHTRALRLAAAYSNVSVKSYEQASLTVSQGLDVMGARVADPRISDKTFTKANAAVSKAIYNDHMALRLAATAQYTDDALPASEKFAVGGAQFGRAFSSAVLSGDRGFAVSAEFALRRPPQAKSLAGSEAYVFADYGKVTQRSAFFRGDDIASAGAGVRVAVRKKAVVELEAAKALDDVAQRAKSRPLRLMINVRSTF